MELEDVYKNSGKNVVLNIALSKTDPARQYKQPDQLFVLTHVPRTAGTTMDNIIRAVAGGRQAFYGRAMGTIYDQFLGEEKEDAAAFIMGKKEHHHEIKYVFGHVPFGIHKKLGRTEATYAVVLRDPLSRLRSQVRLSLKDVPEVSSEDIVNAVKSGRVVDNCQVRMIAGCEDKNEPCDDDMLQRALANLKERYTYVGFQEHFKTFLHMVMKGEQWPSILYVSKHKSSQSKLVLSDAAKSELLRTIELDQVLYNEAKSLFPQAAVDHAAVEEEQNKALNPKTGSDIVFYVEPHTLIGHLAGTIRIQDFEQIANRLKNNGLILRPV